MTNDLAAAVERWNEKQYHTENATQMEKDAFMMANAYTRELDTAPITPELLAADEWAQEIPGTFICGNVRITLSLDRWFIRGHRVTTIGQVRSLLRVFGGGK